MKKFSFHIVVFAVAASLGSLVYHSHLYAGPALYDMRQILKQSYPFTPSNKNVSPPYPENSGAIIGPKNLVEMPEDQNLDVLPKQISDPLEPINRLTFKFNEFILRNLLNPVVKSYNANVPDPIRQATKNFFDNLGEPVTLANDILQGEFKRGFVTTSRFLINSTMGLAGLIDVGDRIGFTSHKEDFGQTLGVWGVGNGFYLILPLLGPSSPRDAIGMHFIDSFFDPMGYVFDQHDLEILNYVFKGIKGVDSYARVVDELERLRETSIDYYGVLRNLYAQKRRTQILNLD